MGSCVGSYIFIWNGIQGDLSILEAVLSLTGEQFSAEWSLWSLMGCTGTLGGLIIAPGLFWIIMPLPASPICDVAPRLLRMVLVVVRPTFVGVGVSSCLLRSARIPATMVASSRSVSNPSVRSMGQPGRKRKQS